MVEKKIPVERIESNFFISGVICGLLGALV